MDTLGDDYILIPQNFGMIPEMFHNAKVQKVDEFGCTIGRNVYRRVRGVCISVPYALFHNKKHITYPHFLCNFLLFR